MSPILLNNNTLLRGLTVLYAFTFFEDAAAGNLAGRPKGPSNT